MQTLAAHSDGLDIRLSLEELVAINNALNEVTNALDIEEFETRMGVSRDVALELLRQIHTAIGLIRQEE
ncbi:hypothetical protein [Roseiflexus sp.]|jgi:hypothetical protein|uniref:hypothetical protein n=1 Tax=Roseiflexus sp. TaxID=2562120 RepID=UPI0025F662BD|nr:hypothetical protein [Roseiflexus sp.]MCL6539637.1 hypothetical protein [Roseiflexus sp.]